MESPPAASSTRMFATTSHGEEPLLCFNKAHFARADFDVQRFMNLTRRRATLTQIHNDLRVYLKSIQNSMIELINDDYADFVSLSSSLVALNEAIEKLDGDVDSIWKEFTNSTSEAIAVAERVEDRCEQLCLNRQEQARIRNHIAFFTSLELLSGLVKDAKQPLTNSWIETANSAVVDVVNLREDVVLTGRDSESHVQTLHKLEQLLKSAAVESLLSDCSLLPALLSMFRLLHAEDLLSSAICAQVVQSRCSRRDSDLYVYLRNVTSDLKALRLEWSKKLQGQFSGRIETFLDHVLLSYLLSFLEQHLSTVLVPSSTKLFHKCFSHILGFIREWPTAGKCRNQLRSIRDKFNLVVYFKLETQASLRDINKLLTPEPLPLLEEKNDENFQLRLTWEIYSGISSVWSDESFLFPLFDKAWDFTLRLLAKHQAWMKAVYEWANDSTDSPTVITRLVLVSADSQLLDSRVFEMCRNAVWSRLRELNIDTTLFGRVLSLSSSSMTKINEQFVVVLKKHLVASVIKELDAVGDVPKQYRWTKKPPPTAASAYVKSGFSKIKEFSDLAEEHDFEGREDLAKSVLQEVSKSFCDKVTQVMETVQATGSSLARFKKKAVTSSEDQADSDETKIRSQFTFDLEACRVELENMNLDTTGVDNVLAKTKKQENGIRNGTA